MTHSAINKNEISDLKGLLEKLSKFSVMTKQDGRYVCLRRIHFNSSCRLGRFDDLPTESAIVEENMVEGLSPTPEIAEMLSAMFQLVPKMLKEVIRLREVIESAPSIWSVDYLDKDNFVDCMRLIEKTNRILSSVK